MVEKFDARSRLPVRFRDASMDSLDREQFEFLFEYRTNLRDHAKTGNGLIISGPPGVGKTWAVAALTLEWAKRAARAGNWHFETTPDILDKYRPMGGPSPVDPFREQPFTVVYETVKWLVVNDLGKEYRGGKMGEQQAAKFGALLRKRSEQRLITVVTTNLPISPSSGPTVESVYGPSVWSLLQECTNGYTVWGGDRRLR